MAVSRPAPDAEKHWPDAPMRPRTRRRIIVAVLVILALSTTAVTTRGVRAMEQSEAPVETVRAFLEASRSGDVDAALALTDDDEPPGSEELLVPEALRDDWEIGELVLRSWLPDSRAEVAATIIGPQDAELTSTFTLERTGQGWKLTDPFTNLPVEAVPLPYLEINGQTIPVEPDDDSGLGFAVLPGVYRLYEHPPELLAYEGAPVIALGADWAETEDLDGIRAVFSGFTAAEGTEPGLNEQMKTYLDGCMAEADGPERFGCPFGFTSWDIDFQGFTPGPDHRWEIVEYPEVVAATVGPMFASDELGLLTRHEGLALMTVADEISGEDMAFECPITTNGLYLWLDETGQYAIGPNGDPAAPAEGDDTAWDVGYRSYCEPA